MMSFMRKGNKKLQTTQKLILTLEIKELTSSPSLQSNCAISIEAKWKGVRQQMSYLRKPVRTHKTMKKNCIEDSLTWEETFSHECVLIGSSSQSDAVQFQPYEVDFIVRKFSSEKDNAGKVMGTVSVNVADYISADPVERTLELPVKLSHEGADFNGVLKVNLQIFPESYSRGTAVHIPAATVAPSVPAATSAPMVPPSVTVLPSAPSKKWSFLGARTVLEVSTREISQKETIPALTKHQRSASMSELRSSGFQADSTEKEEYIVPSPHSDELKMRSLSMPHRGGAGDETEEEDISADESLHYWRIAGGSIERSMPPLIVDIPDSACSSPRSVAESEPAAATAAIAAKQGGLRFLGITFGSSLLPRSSDASTGQAQPDIRANSGSDEEDRVDGQPSAGILSSGLSIKVPVWGGKRKLGTRSPVSMEEPLLNKAYGEDGGDEIDWDRRQAKEAELGHPLHLTEELRKEEEEISEEMVDTIFGDAFCVGRWENREVTSRDGCLKLRTDLFLSSLDQCHEKAAGGGACTNLVALLAEWLHRHPDTMPNRAEFDDLIKQGSAEWRSMCQVDQYKERFPDKHFDLDTVVEAMDGRLLLAPERSFVGFFHPNVGRLREAGKEEAVGFLEGVMSFDAIWEEIERAGPAIYVLSWNDHFFLLVVREDKCFIMDTLGQRLFEGCRQAYILQFNSKSYISEIPPKNSAAAAEGAAAPAVAAASASAGKGNPFAVCGRYVKEFLVSSRLQELENDLIKGSGSSVAFLHQKLQIEMHCTQIRALEQ